MAAVAPMIEAGNVLLPMADEQPWIEDTLLEFVTFPAAKHDDRVDAASQALLWLSKRPIFNPDLARAFTEANSNLTRSAQGGDSDVTPSDYPEGGRSNPFRASRWSM